MTWLSIFLAAYFGLLLLFFVVLLLVFLRLKRDPLPQLYFQPSLSILLAVRNEENNILACLERIAALDYPSEKMEVLIGDDLSEDGTVALIEHFIQDKPNFQLHRIKEQLGLAGAKGNVLAHLAHLAKGEFFFITDADVKVPRSWIHGLLASWSEGVATVSGAATIDGDALLARFQSIDWISAFGMIYTASSIGIPVTAIGNNMMVYRKAYFETGGYENIPFSVTEDFDLHTAVRKLGWKNVNLLNPLVMTRTLPIEGWKNILQQRKRWMHGAVRLPFVLVALLSLHAIFFPVMLLGLIFFTKATLLAWGLKFLMQNAFLTLVLFKTRQSFKLLKASLLYEIYTGICSFVLILYYFLPLKTDWKGRKYA